MTETCIIFQLLLAILLWALIWMERWLSTGEDSDLEFWKLRTFSLFSLMWGVSALLYTSFQSIVLLVIPLILVWVFISIYYWFTVFKLKKLWITSEISALLTYLIWLMVGMGQANLAIMITIILIIILSWKDIVWKIEKKISKEEFMNTLKFATISIVILPLLPDYKFSIVEILNNIWYVKEISWSVFNLHFFNPYGLWFFVVLMSWISYVWYILSKLIGQKGSIILSWAIGGLVSSTATTASMTEMSKKDLSNTSLYIISTLTASMVMFIRVIVIVLFFNINMINGILLPSVFMILGMGLYMTYFYYKAKKEKHKNVKLEKKEYKQPFSIWPAIKFAVFVLFIKFISSLWSLIPAWSFWNFFYYFVWLISGLADVDAISQTMATDALDEKLAIWVASTTILIAVFANNLVKWSIAWRLWEKTFWKSVMLWFIISMLCWFIWIFVLSIL